MRQNLKYISSTRGQWLLLHHISILNNMLQFICMWYPNIKLEAKHELKEINIVLY